MWIVYHRSADSYHSRAELPKAVFDKEEDAIAWASAQLGYGYNVDWFVKSVLHNPTLTLDELREKLTQEPS